MERFTKFFNYGYFLSKFEPKFLKKLLSSTEGNEDIYEPLAAGKAEYNKERFLEKMKSLSKNKGMDKSKDRGIEPKI
jgi:hypothetical protein